jgi:hypothetical protein
VLFPSGYWGLPAMTPLQHFRCESDDFAAERPSSAAPAASGDVEPRETVMAAPVSLSRWILFMASIGVGRSLSQLVKRSRVAPVAAWIFQRSVYLRNHEAGSGRPTPTETMNMRFYNQSHRFYAGGDLHARSLYLHILDDQGLPRQRRTWPDPV